MAKKSTTSQSVPSKLSLLVQMGQCQTDNFTLFAQAELAKSQGDLKTAIPAYDKSIRVGKEHLNAALLHNEHYVDPIEIPLIVQPLTNTMFTAADCYQSIGKLKRAEELRDEAQALAQEHLSPSAGANNERSRAAAMISQGRFNEALVALANARDLFQNEGNTVKVARTTMDMVDILQWLGDFSRARTELRRVIETIAPLVSSGLPTERDVRESLMETIAKIMDGSGDGQPVENMMELFRLGLEIDYYQGLINKGLGNWGDADRFFRKVLPQYQGFGVGPAIEYQLALAQIESGKHKEGLEYAERLEPAFTSDARLRPKLAALLKIQAEALLHLGEPDEALGKLRQGIADLSTYYDPDLMWKLYWLKGRILETLKHEKNALDAYEQAADTVNNLRKAPLGYRLDSTYLKDKLELFEAAIDLACRANDAERCCAFMEMVKSRILTAALSIPPAFQAKATTGLEDEVDEITRQIDALEYTGYLEQKSGELQAQRQDLLAKRMALLERIRFADPRWRNLSEPVPFDLETVSEMLSGRELTALNLFYQSDHIVALLVKDGKCTVGSVKISPHKSSSLKAYLYNLQAQKPNPALFDISASLGINAEHLIPAKLLKQALQNTKGLIIIPHGPLHLIPWAGLMHGRKRLFENCAVGIVPNMSCLASLSTDFSASPKVALVGSPDYSKLPKVKKLEGAKKELRDIQKLYTDHGGVIDTPLTGKTATEGLFWELAGHPDAEGGILHIACHGTYDLSDPMNSALLLADSRIDASEIARSGLRFDEVVLSACHTGWRPVEVQGVELTGDDILGLPGAFLESGVRSVLVSIPPAHDLASSLFMTLYHEFRAGGKTPLAALQETQKTMLTDDEYPPEYWIGFTVYGSQ